MCEETSWGDGILRLITVGIGLEVVIIWMKIADWISDWIDRTYYMVQHDYFNYSIMYLIYYVFVVLLLAIVIWTIYKIEQKVEKLT